ncbi:MAG: hypothetical protein ASARMPRED_007650 [Alectoria sarmentosa]|nr:MAG: hypothetical protein ASARMPRED_007650 [Alectoria sarmentosa]
MLPAGARSLDPLDEPALALEGTEVHAQDLSSIGPDLTGGQDDSDGTFLSVKDMPRGAGEPQEPQNAVSSTGHGRRKADGAVEYPTPIDCDNASTLKAVQGGDTSSEIDGGSGVHPSGDGARMRRAQVDPVGLAIVKPGETGGSTGATSVESKIGPNEQAEAHGYLSIQTTEPITEPIDRPTSPSAALPQHLHKRIVGEDDD